MYNFYRTKKGYKINEKYDLKSSRINRSSAGEEKVTIYLDPMNEKQQNFKIPLFKDNDLQKKIHLQSDSMKDVVRQLIVDVQWLKCLKIMDYSLVLGIHNCTEKRITEGHCDGIDDPEFESALDDSCSWDELTSRERSMIFINESNAIFSETFTKSPFSPSGQTRTPKIPRTSKSPTQQSTEDYVIVNGSKHENSPKTQNGDKIPDLCNFEEGLPARVIIGPGVYHLGLLDILTPWTYTKRMEQLFKIIFRCHCLDYQELSVIEPNFYYERFIANVIERFFELPHGTIIGDLFPSEY